MSRSMIFVWFFAALASAQVCESEKGVNFYSLEEEVALGRYLAAKFGRDTAPLASPATLAYIRAIGQQLAAQIEGPRFTYTFSVVAGDSSPLHEVSAFPGGFLFVPAPLILAVQDEDELAGMMAHGMALVASRGATHQATQAELISTVLTKQPGAWLGSNSPLQSSAISLGLLKMWRKLELGADRCAAARMASAGYDPRALARYYDREQASYDEYSPKMFSPLPPRGRRLDAINTVIGQLPAQVYPPHEGLAKIQEEVRKLLSNSSTAK